MNNKWILVFLLLATLSFSAEAKKDYNKFFTGDRLRIDLIFAGNDAEQSVFLENMHFEEKWSGSHENLIDPFNYGEYMMEVFDTESNRLIFSKGFCSLFSEWRTTQEAKERDMAFTNSVWMPFPKKEVKVVISERDFETELFKPLFDFKIDPADKSINREMENDYKCVEVMKLGKIEEKVDLVFVAEGYTASQMDKFMKDVDMFVTYMFKMEPYKSRKSDFNIWAVQSVSQDSGTDIPHHDIWKNTVACSNFYTFKTDRYLTAPDHKKVAQLVSNVPMDAIFVIVNEEKYGGGGIYNYYALGTSDNKYSSEVFIHEFGHSFAGLGDEYYNSEVAYEDMYNLNTEPWEPNITTKVNFDIKWKDMVGKKGVDLYEGGGYMSKGVFRPCKDCRMKTNSAKGFCPVCQKAISNMIDYYCK